jgi:manganese-dependent inorganic pyrophosphatase
MVGGQLMADTPAGILVVGHRNPDTDAICSALAYADLHTRLTGAAAVACHLDSLGPETAWLLAHLGLPAPRAIADVYLRVADVMLTDAPRLAPGDTVRHAGQLMRDHRLSALPVVAGDGRLLGMILRELLADRYLDLLRLSGHLRRPLASVRAALEAEQLNGPLDATLDGHLWLGTFSAEAARALVRPGDLLIVEDDTALQRAALECKAGCLIIARGAPVAEEIAALARSASVVLLQTAHSSLAAAALLEQSAPVEEALDPEMVSVEPDEVLSEAQRHLRSGNLACLPVVAPDGCYLGLLLRRHLVPQGQRQVILTDHNHPGQAAPGVAESAVLAIIDHHNLGGLQTLQPLTMIVEALGCTCTIIAELYRRAGHAPEPPLAGAMLGAILSDTVAFRSPTTTPRDREAAAWLAELSGEQPDELAHSLFRARLPDPPPPAEWWVGRDWKAYTFGEATIGIAQVELVDVERVAPPVEELRRELAATARRGGLDTAFLILTDILEGGSLLLAADEAGERIATRAFGREFAGHQLSLPDVVSRKKQIVPRIAGAMAEA